VATSATHSLTAALAVAATVTVTVTVTAATAHAESYDLDAALTVASGYDTNPTFAPTPDGAAFWRLEPQLVAGMDSERLTLKLHYLLDAEIYDEAHSALSSPAARQALEGGLRTRLTPELTASVEGAYYNSAVARDLPVVTGVEKGRVRTEAAGVRASLDDALDKRTEIGFEYDLLHLAQAGVDGDTHTEDLALSWKASRRSTLRGDLVAREIVVDFGKIMTVTPMVGWAYALAPTQRLSLRAGPRLGSDGVEDLEADAALRLDGDGSRLEVLYLRTQTAVPGAAAPFAADSLSVKGSATWGAVTATAAPGLFYTRNDMTQAWSARADVEVRGALASWIAVFGGYRLAWQHTPDPVAVSTTSHQVLIGVVAGASVSPTPWPRRGADPFVRPDGDRAERRLP
jgi:hypothetical protein